VPASVAEIAAVRADTKARAASWRADTAAGPDLTPTAVVNLADRALGDARSTVRFVARSFGGTAPPPPWPASDELLAAGKRVQAHRDAAEVIARRAPKATFAAPDKVKAALLRDGMELYFRSDELLEKFAAAPRMPDILALLPTPGKFFEGMPVYLLLLGLWWFLEDTPRRARIT
jgi:hypothetical protein